MSEIVAIPFIALAGDIVVSNNAIYSKGYEHVLNSEAISSVALSNKLDVIDSHGIGKVSDGRVIAYEYPPPQVLSQDMFRDMTIWGIGKLFYQYASQHRDVGSTSGVIKKAVDSGELVVANVYEDQWVHFGYPEDLQKKFK